MEFKYDQYFQKYKELAFNDEVLPLLDQFKALALKT